MSAMSSNKINKSSAEFHRRSYQLCTLYGQLITAP